MVRAVTKPSSFKLPAFPIASLQCPMNGLDQETASVGPKAAGILGESHILPDIILPYDEPPQASRRVTRSLIRLNIEG
jgi:hypothetical protein